MKSLHLLLILQLLIIFTHFPGNDGAFCRRPVDIAFAVDASGSVGQWGYAHEKNFVQRIVHRFGISQSGTHAAVIVYSTTAQVEIPLARYFSYPRFYYAVGRLPYRRGVTRIDLALKAAANDVFDEEGGARSNVPKILIVMTDGYQTRTTDSVSLDKAILPLRAKGVQVYALAIGQYTKDYELRLIVEKKKDIFRANSFSRLTNVIRRLTRIACANALPIAFAIYPLNKQIQGRDISARRAPSATLSSVSPSSGPNGRPGGSFYLQGTSNSFLDFPNRVGGKLDAWSSISIFLWVYPEGRPGPIVNYGRRGRGIGLWLSGTRLLEGHIYSRRRVYRRKLYFYRFRPRKWYYVGLMYDNAKGIATLWVNGRVFFHRRISRIYLATQHPVRMGAVNNVRQYFRGRVTCLQIYGMVLNTNQINSIKKKCAAKDQKDPCLSSPCKNGGSCIIDADKTTGYRCRCRPGYSGHRCEVKAPQPTTRPTGRPTGRRTGRPKGRRTGRPTARTPSAGFRIEIVEYINRFRRLHGAGPLILSSRISMVAQNWALTLVSRGTASIDPGTSYGTNVFSRIGTQNGLAQISAVSWYSTVKFYDWAKRKPKVRALPFVHLVWLSSNFVGVGLARSPTGKYYVVVYFDPMPGNKEPLLKDNVLPYTDVFILMQGVTCNPGYKKHEGTCYKYHSDKQTWEGALFESAKENATLVSFHKSHEEAFVQTLLPAGNTGLIWTGMNDRLNEGTYTWSDGTSVEYSTWKENEPTGEKEDCVGVEVISYGTMSDVPCSQPHNYVSRQPLEGLITYRAKLQLPSLLWTDEYSQSTSLSYMELKQKIESLLLVIFQNDKTLVSGYVEEFSKNTKTQPQTTTAPTKPGLPTPASSAATALPSTRPTWSRGPTPATTPTSSGVTTTKISDKPTVTTSIILKFGPDVAPDPTIPIQDHLRKNLGRLPAPVNHKTLFKTVRIVRPGAPPAVLGTCSSSCLTTCYVSCNPFCCNSKIPAISNAQHSGTRYGMIVQAVPKGYVMPNVRPQVRTLPVQVVAPQTRLMSYPVTLSVRCVPHFLRPCPPGTQVAQRVQGSYNMRPFSTPSGMFQAKPRPFVSLPQLMLPRAPALIPNYPNQQAFLPRTFTTPMQAPCIPSPYNSCSPPKHPPAKPMSVMDSPIHVIHLPPAQRPSNVMRPPCVPTLYNPCPPPKTPPMKPLSVINSPLHVIHLPPAPQPPRFMQQPCVPNPFNPCAPYKMSTKKPTAVVDSPLHVIHLPPVPPPSSFMRPPCIPSAFNLCPPPKIPVKPTSVLDSPLHVIHLPPAPPAPPPPPPLFIPRPAFVPVICIPRPYYPCPQNSAARKLSKPSHKKGKSRTFMPKPAAGSYQFPYGAQPYMRPLVAPVAPYIPFASRPMFSFPMQQPAQFTPRSYAMPPLFQMYRPPLWPQYAQRPLGVGSWTPIAQSNNDLVKNAPANNKPKQLQPKPIPAKGPVTIQGSILLYPKPVQAVPPRPPSPPQVSAPCSPSPANPCVPFRLYPMVPNTYPAAYPCIPSLANPCRPILGKPIGKPVSKTTTPSSTQSKPILLTRPLQLQGSVYINPRPVPPAKTAYPGTVPCVPTATRPCSPLIPPLKPLSQPRYVAPRISNPPFPLIPQQPVRNVAPFPANANIQQQAPVSQHSLVVQLPEISLVPVPAAPSALSVPAPQSSNCPISCVRYPGPFCPPYCAAYCCKRKTTKQPLSKKKPGHKLTKKVKKEKTILKVKKPGKG